MKTCILLVMIVMTALFSAELTVTKPFILPLDVMSRNMSMDAESYGLLLLGYSEYPSSNGFRPNAVLLDRHMEMKSELILKDRLGGTVNSVLLLPGGGFLLTCLVNERSLDTTEAAVMVSAGGRTVWSTPIPGEVFRGARPLLACADGGFLVGGSLEAASFYMRTAWVAKLSPEGDIQWTYTYDTGIENCGSNFNVVLEVGDGYILAGASEDGEGLRNALVMKLDPLGDEVWRRSHGGEGFSDFACAAEVPGGFAFGGTDSEYDPRGSVVRTDSLGRELWSYSIDTGEELNYVTGIAVSTDGVIVTAGYRWGDPNVSVLEVLDPEGDVIDHLEFPAAETGLFLEIIEDDGSMEVIGEYRCDSTETISLFRNRLQL